MRVLSKIYICGGKKNRLKAQITADPETKLISQIGETNEVNIRPITN